MSRRNKTGCKQKGSYAGMTSSSLTTKPLSSTIKKYK